MMTKAQLDELTELADFAHETAFDIGADGTDARRRMFAVADALRRCKDEIEGLRKIEAAADAMRLAWHDVKIYGQRNGHLTIEGAENMSDAYERYLKAKECPFELPLWHCNEIEGRKQR